MCGVAGYWSRSPLPEAAAQDALGRMTTALAHRGPDDSGAWFDLEAGLAVGHRRLAILDLTEEGHQPMVSRTGRFVISYNGEVYNFAELRQELDQAHAGPWRGGSDTEVMLAAIEAWGLEEAVGRFVGMFAFALWDRSERTLCLVRDRLGIKPLYYAWTRDSFVFGSELRALTVHPELERRVDPQALASFLRYGYVPAPQCILAEARKLSPATILTVRDPSSRQSSSSGRFWSAARVAEDGLRDPFRGTEDEAADALEQELLRAVRLRMVADVPLGAFLSGGIDSSTVVSLMQAQSSRRVKTFSIGVHDARYDEAQSASAVASHLGTDHTELYVTGRDALEIVPHLPDLYDEPFADSSQIPTYLVSRLARRTVTVALSGDGGDEVFGGYNRHFWAPRIWAAMGWAPGPARALVARMLVSVPVSGWDLAYKTAAPILPRGLTLRRMGDQAHKLASILAARSPDEMYDTLSSQWQRPGEVVRGADATSAVRCDTVLGGELAASMMHRDLVTYLPGDILTKVDRASMAVSLEARVPLLDHRVVAFAWTLPLWMKIRGTTGKRILRRVLYRHVPAALVERPKMGFGIPLETWLRRELRDWAEDLLDPRRLARDGYFNVQPIRACWDEHLSGRRNLVTQLWPVLVFQQWLAATGRGAGH